MRDAIRIASECGRRYREAVDPTRFPHGLKPRALDAAFRAYVQENPEIYDQREQFVRAAQGGDPCR